MSDVKKVDILTDATNCNSDIYIKLYYDVMCMEHTGNLVKISTVIWSTM